MSLDRLRVFVSSTINECATERSVIRDAIHSLNHEPVLFEEIGARPHPPREVYTTRLEESHVFIGVYRESYGWVAPEMEISGVEDEFHIASRRRMDRLIYVFDTQGARDERLSKLIEMASRSGVTTARYSDPGELEGFVRRDVTAVVSARFVDRAIVLRDMPGPEDVLNSVLPETHLRFRRPSVERKIVDLLDEKGRLIVVGAIGSGKTVIITQLAKENDWIFLDGHQISRLDIVCGIANAIRGRVGKPPITVTTEREAIDDYLVHCATLPETTIAVDGFEHPEELGDLPVGKHRLLLTARYRFVDDYVEGVDLPKLTRDEIRSWITAMRCSQIGTGELAKIVELSEGSPLYLRFCSSGEIGGKNETLRDLEIRAFRSLQPREREIVTYAALSDQSLTLGDLTELVCPVDGPEALSEYFSRASGLLRQTGGRVQLIHEHLRETVIEHLRRSPARYAFFTGRLGRYLETMGRFLSAFKLYSDANDREQADRLLKKAENQAVLFGGGSAATRVFRRQAEIAREMGRHSEEAHSLLNLAHTLAQNRQRSEVQTVISLAP